MKYKTKIHMPLWVQSLKSKECLGPLVTKKSGITSPKLSVRTSICGKNSHWYVNANHQTLLIPSFRLLFSFQFPFSCFSFNISLQIAINFTYQCLFQWKLTLVQNHYHNLCVCAFISQSEAIVIEKKLLVILGCFCYARRQKLSLNK